MTKGNADGVEEAVDDSSADGSRNRAITVRLLSNHESPRSGEGYFQQSETETWNKMQRKVPCGDLDCFLVWEVTAGIICRYGNSAQPITPSGVKIGYGYLK